MKNQERLNSWKEISIYVNREIRTCYRWAKELNFPVRRIDEKSVRSRVFAYKNEIDDWFSERKKYV